MIKTLIAIGAVGAVALTVSPGGHADMDKMTAETYEHLATAIIAIRETEDNLVKGILVHGEAMAQRHLEAAMGATGSDRGRQLEEAADQITNIANEGDKRIQAIRQKLLKAGHHHHSDAETEEDYMFVDSGEKAELLGLARRVSKLGSRASDDQIEEASRELAKLFERIVE